jgi:hypothetical protein
MQLRPHYLQPDHNPKFETTLNPTKKESRKRSFSLLPKISLQVFAPKPFERLINSVIVSRGR